jgi:hypothetical protein
MRGQDDGELPFLTIITNVERGGRDVSRVEENPVTPDRSGMLVATDRD